ncbi:MAG: DUF4058 family protein, partial [Bacteroidota bacterium]
MKSPFPGMDPFIEGRFWQDFHVSFIVEMKRQLVPQLPDEYELLAELSITSHGSPDGYIDSYQPDIGIAPEYDPSLDYGETVRGDYATLTPPTAIREKVRVKQRYLTIRNAKTKQLITAIEMLSPSNKAGKGLLKYKKKRADYVNAAVSLIEIDLLRGGDKPYAEGDWPLKTYHVVSVEYGTTFKLWALSLEDKLPKIPVPLAYEEPPLVLDLQAAFV